MKSLFAVFEVDILTLRRLGPRHSAGFGGGTADHAIDVSLL